MGHLHPHIFRKRRERERDTSYDILIAIPHAFGTIAADSTSVTNLALPAGARLALSHSAALSQSDITVNIATRLSFSHPALDADEVHPGVWGEETMVVSITRGSSVPAGTLTLYMVDAFGLHRAIGTATLS